MSERDMDTAEQSQFGMAHLKREGGIALVDDPWEECNDETERKPPSPMVMPDVVGPHMFVFRPKGYGQRTMCVVANSPEDALNIITAHVVAASVEESYEYLKFGTGYYEVTAIPHGQVVENENQ